MVLNGMLWRAGVVSWRDVPPSFGHRKTNANRHRRWQAKSACPGPEYLVMGTFWTDRHHVYLEVVDHGQ